MPPKLIKLIKIEEIDSAVQRLASELSRDYRGKTPLLIVILKGLFIFPYSTV